MTMAKSRLAWLALLIVFFFGGCGHVPKQAFNRAANQDVKTVVILKPPVLKEHLVQNWGHPGMGFGLVGGIIAAVDMQSKTTGFTDKIKALNFDPSGEFSASLAQELRACGYEVTVMEVERPKPAVLESYDAVDAKVEKKPDAYIDVVLNWSGYFTSSPVADYLPAERVLVRMVRRQSKEIAYQELINYGYELLNSQSINLTADGKYRFGNYDALMANPDRALEGLRLGIPLLAKQVARDLAPEGYIAPVPLPAPVPVSVPPSTEATPQAQEAVLRPQ